MLSIVIDIAMISVSVAAIIVIVRNRKSKK